MRVALTFSAHYGIGRLAIMRLGWSAFTDFTDTNQCRADLTSFWKDRRIAAVVKSFGW